MGATTEIAWTDATFNPWWGCARVSPGCEHCYAETFAKRVGLKVWGAKSEHRRFGDKHWNEPRKWNRDAERAGTRRRVFCASMADVFEGRDEDAADRERLWALIEETPWLDWQLLTKRPESMTQIAPARWATGWPRNVWAGCTVEDQRRADERVLHLLRVPAAVRFLSVEPLLGPVDLRTRRDGDRAFCGPVCDDHGKPGIDWVIVGGESGHGARPMHPAWARSIRDQCVAAGVPFFFKQWGEWAPWGTHFKGEDGQWDRFVNPDGSTGACAISSMDHETVTNWAGDLNADSHLITRVGKKAAGRLLDGRTWDEMPDPRP